MFTSPSKTTFKVKGTYLGTMPKVILRMKAKKLVKDRVWAILVNATNTKKKKKKGKKETTLVAMSVANKFSDVFPEDLSRAPPSREVYFETELERGTDPISKSLCRMVTTKLKNSRHNCKNY